MRDLPNVNHGNHPTHPNQVGKIHKASSQQFPITGATQLLGVLGWPIEHSLSPIMQNAALQAHKINAVYVPIPVSPNDLSQALQGIKSMHFVGVNVTIPHKTALAACTENNEPIHLDELSEISRFTGSVNTIYSENGKWIGTSTDAAGAFKNLQSHGHQLTNQHVIILGNGGAARALAFELAYTFKDTIASLRILGRNLEHVNALCQAIAQAPVATLAPQAGLLSDFAEYSEQSTLIINTTPVGMAPHEDECPIDASALRKGQIVYDIVYTPLFTQLLRQAQLKGCRTVTGIGMLIHQGALSFEKWFGIYPDNQLMARTLEAYQNQLNQEKQRAQNV